MSLTSKLFRAARLSADARAVRRGRVGRRAANKLIGRTSGIVSRCRWLSQMCRKAGREGRERVGTVGGTE